VNSQIESFIHRTVEAVRPLEKAYTLSDWELATTGTPEATQLNVKAQAAYMRFWAAPSLFTQAKRLDTSGKAENAEQARQLRLIHLTSARNQQDEATIQDLTRLEAAARGQYYNFRGKIGGKELDDNALEALLRNSSRSDEVREAWLASKQVGALVADQVRQLARIRNAAARAHGFRDHFQRALTLDEIDENQLLTLFAELEQYTRKPYEKLKAKIDGLRSAHFGLKVDALRPWHYGDRFFQEVPPLGQTDMDTLYAGKDLVALGTATYDGIGIDVRDILARSDLYARPGKNQHAFSTHIDRQGDIRTLNNLAPNLYWATTILHELGHAAYEKHLDPDLPWLLRAPAHTLTTEAIAILMGSLTVDPEWMTQVLGLAKAQANRLSEDAREIDRAGGLIFTRWCLVMTYFEMAMYADPERDLDTLWWDLIERYQLLRRPEGRRAPDWAAKIHVALVPVYYQNYELGHLVKDQLLDRIRKQAGGVVGRKEAGRWLIERVFKPGAREDWAGHVARATGEPLNPKYFVKAVGG
jgi:peptidyl-dipeptidase A